MGDHLDKLPPIEWSPTYQALLEHLKEQQRLGHRLPTEEDILSTDDGSDDESRHMTGRSHDKVNDD